MKYVFSLSIFLALIFGIHPLYSAMSGGDFEIYADTFGFIESSTSSVGSSFVLTASGEGFQAVSSTDGTFELRSGFQAQEKGILSINTSETSIDLGTFSESTVVSSSMTVWVSTDSETGYSLAISEDGNFRTSGGDTVDDVSDGTVTAGSEEYGIEVTGSDSVLSGDNGISGSLTIASALGRVTGNITTITFKGAMSASTAAGSYTHIVTFTTTVNP